MEEKVNPYNLKKSIPSIDKNHIFKFAVDVLSTMYLTINVVATLAVFHG